MKKLKGSLTIEAAMVLSTLLLVIFSIIYLVKVVYIHEQFQMALSEVAQQMSVEAYLLEKSGLLDLQQATYLRAKGNVETFEQSFTEVTSTLNGLTDFHETDDIVTSDSSSGVDSEGIFQELRFQIVNTIGQSYDKASQLLNFIQMVTEDSKKIITSLGVVPGLELINNTIGSKIVKSLICERIKSEDLEKWGIIGGEAGLDFSQSRFMLEDEDISLILHYQINFPFLKDIVPSISMIQSVQVRAFTGDENFESRLQAEEPEGSEAAMQESTVYITKSGRKYHQDRTCRYIDVKVNPISYNLVELSKRLCEVCAKEGELLVGSMTVFTTKASQIYHTNSQCWTIKRDVSAVTMDEARDNGYTKCSLCGGEHHE
ncbi:MAG: pilus assembly protein [Vallitaleaceae bacterium]|nr:pilus assembly protein [Vallitaleaceae bacterium]